MILSFEQKPYINAGIFLDHIRTSFLPFIDPPRGLVGLAQEIAVLFLDNFSAHVSDIVIRIPTEGRCAS
jgi:hypothetical protein